jgi:hypothetical protein
VVCAPVNEEVPIQVRRRFTCKSAFSEWRDPDSNRGHHDFQSYAKALRYAELPHR